MSEQLSRWVPGEGQFSHDARVVMYVGEWGYDWWALDLTVCSQTNRVRQN